MTGCTFLCTFISFILPDFLAVDEISRCLGDFLHRVETVKINAMSKRLVSYWERKHLPISFQYFRNIHSCRKARSQSKSQRQCFHS